jgi:hypothetical protein
MKHPEAQQIGGGLERANPIPPRDTEVEMRSWIEWRWWYADAMLAAGKETGDDS